MSSSSDKPANPSRRAALRRLGMAVVAAYVVPEVVLLSEARASGVSPPSGVSVVTPPTPPSEPSGASAPEAETPTGNSRSTPSRSRDTEADDLPSDACRTPDNSGAAIQISETDFKQAQASVDAGYAKPLEAIWGDFTSQYSGRVIGVEFTGYRYRPTYRLKAISPTGHLETVLVSARTGKIIRIIGC